MTSPTYPTIDSLEMAIADLTSQLHTSQRELSGFQNSWGADMPSQLAYGYFPTQYPPFRPNSAVDYEQDVRIKSIEHAVHELAKLIRSQQRQLLDLVREMKSNDWAGDWTGNWSPNWNSNWNGNSFVDPYPPRHPSPPRDPYPPRDPFPPRDPYPSNLLGRNWVAVENLQGLGHGWDRHKRAPFYVSGEVQTVRGARQPALRVSRHQGRDPSILVLDLIEGSASYGGTRDIQWRNVRYDQNVNPGQYRLVQINRRGSRLALTDVRQINNGQGHPNPQPPMHLILSDGPNLEYGSSGNQVRILQQMLANLNYGIKVDGDFRDKTRDAVMTFQRRENLKADGIVGSATRNVLNSISEGGITHYGHGFSGHDSSGHGSSGHVSSGHGPNGHNSGGWGSWFNIFDTPQRPHNPSTPNSGHGLIDGSLLEYGSKGAQVRTLQQMLASLNYDIKVDGDYRDKTRDAVIEFQRRENLKPDGLVGAATWNALNDIIRWGRSNHGHGSNSHTSNHREPWVNVFDTPQQPRPSIALSDGPALEHGSSGRQVRILQQILESLDYEIKVDGDFGDKTRDAVIAFQKRENLKPDGVVGPTTRSVLNDVSKWGRSRNSNGANGQGSSYI